MSLPDSTITLLQDEAYLHLCRKTVDDALGQTAAQRTEVESTRPPFGILATRSTRQAFQASLQTVLTGEAALRSRLAKITLLENALKSRIQRELHAFLERASADYGKSSRVLAVIDAWELLLPTYNEKLKALARELREASQSVQYQIQTSHEDYERRIRALAQLRFAAVSVDGAANQMETVSQRIPQAGGALFSCITLPEPPFIRQTEWTDRVIKLPDPELVAALNRAESGVRSLIADNLALLRTHAARARNLVGDVAYQYLEHYWSQLRAHAQAHYVSESDVDDVIARLEERYIAADIQQRMHALAEAVDPYGFVR
jgi:hypothetical protein